MKCIYLILIFICSSATASEVNPDTFFLRTKYIETIPKDTEDKSYKDENGDWVIVPTTIYMKFEVVENIHSDAEFEEKTLILPLEVGTDYPFSLSNGVIFVLKKDRGMKETKYTILDWDFVGEFFCIDEELVTKTEKDYYFQSPLRGHENRVCRFL